MGNPKTHEGGVQNHPVACLGGGSARVSAAPHRLRGEKDSLLLVEPNGDYNHACASHNMLFASASESRISMDTRNGDYGTGRVVQGDRKNMAPPTMTKINAFRAAESARQD